MNNMEIWEKVKRPPTSVLTPIKGGRLSGMTDISPQWRYQVMTEVFGPCGVGWKYEIKKLWTEDGANGEKMAFALIDLYTALAWSQAIPGIGGSAMIAKEKDGLRANDEAYKMAVTDALSVAMKQLGVAADIYIGLFDGSKYKTELPKASENGPATPRGGAWEALDEHLRVKLQGIADECRAVIEEGNVRRALSILDEEEFDDAAHKVALWDRFTSKERTAMTKEREAIKKEDESGVSQ